MINGHEKLIAKVQHFYDMLIQRSERNSDVAITTNEIEHKTRALVLMLEYAEISSAFMEVFKEFLYKGNPDEI